jgi:tetratricopeptide (TPR) repeat protein
MGRTKPKKKAHSKATVPPIQHATPSNAPLIPSLLEKAQSLIVQCDYELALRFIRRILEQAPSNAEAKEMLGVALLEMGEVEGAKEVCIYSLNSILGFDNFINAGVPIIIVPRSQVGVSPFGASISSAVER